MPCGRVGEGCSVRELTDVVGCSAADPACKHPKANCGHYGNLTRAECCAKCTANSKCQVWARPPGDRKDCWLVSGYFHGTEHSSTREVGCPGDRRGPGNTTTNNHYYNTSSSSSSIGTTIRAQDGHANTGVVPWWLHGISGEVQSIPAGFTHTTILTVGNGITDGLQQWGSTIRKAQPPPPKRPDIVTSHLSYWTDNGAYYYMYGAASKDADCDYMAHGPMDQVFLKLVESWARMGLPVRSIQV